MFLKPFLYCLLFIYFIHQAFMMMILDSTPIQTVISALREVTVQWRKAT